jgi:hypothetical protein
MAWTVETLNETVDTELAELPADMRARSARIAELIEAVGLPNVREPHVRHIRGPNLGDSSQGEGWHRPRVVCCRQGAARCHRPCIRQEDREDAGW